MAKCACCNFAPELNIHHSHLQGGFDTEDQECVDYADMLALKRRNPEGAEPGMLSSFPKDILQLNNSHSMGRYE